MCACVEVVHAHARVYVHVYGVASTQITSELGKEMKRNLDTYLSTPFDRTESLEDVLIKQLLRE